MFRQLARGLTFTALLVLLAAYMLMLFMGRISEKPHFVPPTDLFVTTVVLAYLLTAYTVSLFIELAKDIRDVIRFGSFKEKIMAKYKQLGGNLEDLDKEENEQEETKETPKKKQHRR